MNHILAVLICVALVVPTLWGLRSFAGYTGRRAALADPPDVWFGPGSDRWLAILLVVVIVSMLVCLSLCLIVLRVVGGFAP